jgi:hypothetical protein
LANDESEHAFGALSLRFKMANDGGGELHISRWSSLLILSRPPERSGKKYSGPNATSIP